MTETRNSDTILANIKGYREKGIKVPKEQWLEISFDLNLFCLDEAYELNRLNQEVAKLKVGILHSQDKKNVALADSQIEASEEYRKAKNQEDKVYAIREFVRIAKKNSENDF